MFPHHRTTAPPHHVTTAPPHHRTDTDERGPGEHEGHTGEGFPYALLGTWGLTRLLLLLFVSRVFVFPGPDVTSDVSVIYQGWYEILRTGTFPLDDVTWQYP